MDIFLVTVTIDSQLDECNNLQISLPSSAFALPNCPCSLKHESGISFLCWQWLPATLKITPTPSWDLQCPGLLFPERQSLWPPRWTSDTSSFCLTLGIWCSFRWHPPPSCSSFKPSLNGTSLGRQVALHHSRSYSLPITWSTLIFSRATITAWDNPVYWLIESVQMLEREHFVTLHYLLYSKW